MRCKSFVFKSTGAAIVFAAMLVAGAVALGNPGRGPLVGIWATGPAGPDGTPGTFDNQTLRLIVNANGSGDQVRIEISNEFGTEPLEIGAAHIALRKTAASIVPGSDHTLTFSGQPSFSVPAGALVMSDAADLHVTAFANVAVSLYLPKPTQEKTTHVQALETSYVAAAAGDSTGAADLPGAATIKSWPFLTGLAVAAHARLSAIVTLGDSITDGADSATDSNHRWPDYLARRLQADKTLSGLSVLNQGIIGNRILHPTEMAAGNLFGIAGLARFNTDVLAQPGVKFVIVLLGINDIGHPGANAPLSDTVSAKDMEAGYLQMIVRAHANGIKIYGATLTPFFNTTLKGFYSEAKEEQREAVNSWIRTSGAFDGVIDFDRAMRDPANLKQMLAAYDSGDHLHPSDAGMKAMAEAIDLRLFRRVE